MILIQKRHHQIQPEVQGKLLWVSGALISISNVIIFFKELMVPAMKRTMSDHQFLTISNQQWEVMSNTREFWIIQIIWKVNNLINITIIFYCSRLLYKTKAELCEDLFWHSNLWSDHQRQVCKVHWYIGCYWWNYGTIVRVLCHQCSGNYILCCQDNCLKNEEAEIILL